MNKPRLMTQKWFLRIAAAVCCLAFSGCVYEIPITSGPTRKVEENLLGDWVSKDGKDKIKVRRLDDSIYIVSVNGYLFRAYHSDVANAPFASVQEIESQERRYTYVTWKLSEDGKRLNWRALSTKVIPRESKDSAVVQNIIEKNLQNPEMFEDELEFTKEKQ